MPPPNTALQGTTNKPRSGARLPTEKKKKSAVTATETRLASVSAYKARHKLCNLINTVIIKYLFCIMKC